MSFFRKLGHNLAPMFRKLPADIGRFGRKLSTGAHTVEHGLDKAANVMGKINRVLPNPITKAIEGGLHAGSDIAGAVGKGGTAIDLLSHGRFGAAANMGKQALNEGTSGFTKGLGVATSVAPLIL